MSKSRWDSIWHQLNEVVNLQPEKVLEIGPGPGLFKSACSAFRLCVETLDLDVDLTPDHIGSATKLPFSENSFDVVCAFQMLEHLPFSDSVKAFNEMIRVSKKNIVISLPDSRPVWRFAVYIPKIGLRRWMVNRPRFSPVHHEFDGEHYWEVEKRGYSLSEVVSVFEKEASASLLQTYRIFENPYHRFFIFEKVKN